MPWALDVFGEPDYVDAAEHRRQMWRLRKRRQKDHERHGRVILHVEIEDVIGRWRDRGRKLFLAG